MLQTGGLDGGMKGLDRGEPIFFDRLGGACLSRKKKLSTIQALHTTIQPTRLQHPNEVGWSLSRKLRAVAAA